MTSDGFALKVKAVIVKVLDLSATATELDERTPLYSAEIRLDSLTLLQLITELENAFSCQIDDESVMSADLVDVGSLIQLVKSQADH